VPYGPQFSPLSSGLIMPFLIRIGVAMNDLLYIGLTIVIFLLLALLVKGVEHFER
jgi:hypothetical protein